MGLRQRRHSLHNHGPLTAGEVIYFTDDEWNGTSFNGSEQLIEWTVPAGGLDIGTVVEIEMTSSPADASFSEGGSVDYIRGGGKLAQGNEMFWAFQGTRVGDTVTPTDFIGVIANEADGNNNQTPNLSGTGLTTSNGAIIIDGDEDYMEFTAEASLSDPVNREDLISAVSDLSNWTTDDGAGNNNPNGTGFDLDFPTVVCFTPGAMIRTPQGLRPVETLAVGDLVETEDHGAQAIRWIGRRRLGPEVLQRHHNLRPIRIKMGAFGPGCPDRDTWVSPQHRLLVGGPRLSLMFGESEALAPAVGLCDGDSIQMGTRSDGVTYIHFLFDSHELVRANGLRTESFLPGDCSVSGLLAPMRAELFSVFPELAVAPGGLGPAARPLLRVGEALALA